MCPSLIKRTASLLVGSKADFRREQKVIFQADGGRFAGKGLIGRGFHRRTRPL
jgi:hypothetical protein